jgi:hypothetical protein
VFEARGFQGILYNLRHFNDPLLQAITTTLLARSVTDECRLALTIWDMLRLCGFDFSVGDFLESSLGFVRRCSDLLFRRAIHCPVCVGEILAVREWNEVLELRLNYFAISLPLLSNRVVTNVAFRVDLERECVSRGRLPVNY